MDAQQLSLSPIEIVATTGERVAADTGWLTVPSKHGVPGSSPIRLPILRLRGTAPNGGTPIVYLAGGPGNAGLPRNNDILPFFLELRTVGDVVLFDQRGTGRSEPRLALSTAIEVPGQLSLDAPEADQYLVKWAEQGAAEMRTRGVDLSAYNTVESVHDLDAIRQGLGYNRWIVWGHSYGSHLALAYLRAHETRVDRLLIGGVNGPDDRWRRPADGTTFFERIDSTLRASPRYSAIFPDFLNTTKRVLERLQATPLTTQVNGATVTLGRRDVEATIALLGGEYDFVQRLPSLMQQLAAGNPNGFARFAMSAVRRRPGGTAMTYAMHIASGVSPKRRAAIEKETPGAILRDAINYPWDVRGFSAAWGVSDLGESFRAPVRSRVPTLMYSGTLDGRTSLRDAQDVRKGLAKSTHIVVTGASHTPHMFSEALRARMLAFAKGESVRDETINLPIEFNLPNEAEQLSALNAAMAAGIDAVISKFRELANSATGTSTFAARTVANDLLDKRRFADGVAFLTAAVEIFPNEARLFMRLGEAYEGSAQPANAITAYERAIQLDGLLTPAIARLRALRGR